jgi:hypothetical protein
MPHLLKGVDMAVYEVFKHIGLKVELVPILDDYQTSSLYPDEESNITVVGTKIHQMKGTYSNPVEDIDDVKSFLREVFPYNVRENIVWANGKGWDEMAAAMVTVGRAQNFQTLILC